MTTRSLYTEFLSILVVPRTFQETTIIIEDNSFIAYTVYAIIIMNKNEHESPHSDQDRAVLSASLQDSFIPTIN